MKHGRTDYNGRIVDLASLTKDPAFVLDLLLKLEHDPPARPIAEDEPVFVLRASDMIAPHIVREYARRARQEANISFEAVAAITDQATAMDEWQVTHGAKLPDAPLPAT